MKSTHNKAERLARLATRILPGEWVSQDITDSDDPDCGMWVIQMGERRWYWCDMEDCTGQEIHTADFIAEARTDAPEVAAEYLKQEKALELAIAALKFYGEQPYGMNAHAIIEIPISNSPYTRAEPDLGRTAQGALEAIEKLLEDN